jgi:hypothetical protein
VLDRVTLGDIEGLYGDALRNALGIARLRGVLPSDLSDVFHDAVVVMLRRRRTFTHASAQYFYEVVKNLARAWREKRARIEYVRARTSSTSSRLIGGMRNAVAASARLRTVATRRRAFEAAQRRCRVEALP